MIERKILMNDKELQKSLEEMEKKQIISLFLKLKIINNGLCARLELVENQLNDLISLDTLIASINDTAVK